MLPHAIVKTFLAQLEAFTPRIAFTCGTLVKQSEILQPFWDADGLPEMEIECLGTKQAIF